MIGWKVLRADGSSLRQEARIYYPLPVDGQPGAWIDVPGNGAYVAVEENLFAGEFGPLLVQIESDDSLDVCDADLAGVHCWRHVRVLRTCDWSELPPRFGRVVMAGEHTLAQGTLIALGTAIVRNQIGGQCYYSDQSQSHDQIGGWCHCYDQAQSHGQTGGWCHCYGQAQSHGQTGGWCRCSDQVQAHGQIGGWCYCYGQAQSHGQIGGKCYCSDQSHSHGQTGGWCRCHGQAQSHGQTGGMLATSGIGG